MTAISQYIFKQLVIAALFVAVALTLVVTLFGSLRLVEFIVNRGLPVSVLLELSMLRIPGFLTVVLPIAGVAAILSVYNKLLTDSELVVMRATGMSQWALARPGLYLALLLMAFSYALHLYVTPLTYATFKAQRFNYRNALGSVMLQERQFNNPGDGVTVYIRHREGPGELRGIFAHDARNPAKPVTYLAERGTATQTDSGMRVVLFNGSQQLVNKETGRLTLFYFDQYSLDLGFLNQQAESRWVEPRERFLPDLFHPGTDANDRFYGTQLIAEGHRRLVSPLYIMAYVLVGLASLLLGDFNRRGHTIRILAAIGIVIVLQLAGLSLFNLSRKILAFVPLTYALPLLTSAAASFLLFRDRHLDRRASGAAELAEPSRP